MATNEEAEEGEISVEQTHHESAKELRGVILANSAVSRISVAGLRLPNDVTPPEGPHFLYEAAPSLFLGRSGRGPLTIAWDTNLLIDYFEHGEQLWKGDSLPACIPEEHAEELEGLQIVISLWVLRDMRFHLPPGVLTDSKRKPLSAERRAQRIHAWNEFESALGQATHDEPACASPRALSADAATALAAVPAGNDRALVGHALTYGLHVFLTRDDGVLAARAALAPMGLAVLSPLDLLEELGAAGALHCLFEPRYLDWPIPNQQRVSHLIRALSSGASSAHNPR